MLIGGVVHDQVEEQPDAALAGFDGQFGEVTERSEPRVDAVVVADVIAVVTLWEGWMGLSHRQVTPSRAR